MQNIIRTIGDLSLIGKNSLFFIHIVQIVIVKTTITVMYRYTIIY